MSTHSDEVHYIEMAVFLVVFTFHSVFIIKSFKRYKPETLVIRRSVLSHALLSPLLNAYHELDSAASSLVPSDLLRMPPPLLSVVRPVQSVREVQKQKVIGVVSNCCSPMS